MLTKTEFDHQILVRIAYVTSHENSYSRSRDVSCRLRDGWTDMTKLNSRFLHLFYQRACTSNKQCAF